MHVLNSTPNASCYFDVSLFLQETYQTVPPTTAVQTAQKNLSQATNGSSVTAPASSQQNSTVDVTVDPTTSSSSGDVGSSTVPAVAIITTPTQAGEEAAELFPHNLLI